MNTLENNPGKTLEILLTNFSVHQLCCSSTNLSAFISVSGLEIIVPEGFTLTDHLAIDWIARNLYWTCPQYNKIYASRLDGSEIIVIVDTDLEEPRGVAVDPGDG